MITYTDQWRLLRSEHCGGRQKVVPPECYNHSIDYVKNLSAVPVLGNLFWESGTCRPIGRRMVVVRRSRSYSRGGGGGWLFVVLGGGTLHPPTP